MTKHAYLATPFFSDKGSAFISRVNKEGSSVLRVTLKPAPTEHTQKIGMPESSHVSIKQALKIELRERRSL